MCNLFSVKTATRNDIVSIFDRENPRLEAFGVTLPLRGNQDDLYSSVLDLSADAFGATELAMNAVFNVQLWHRRLGHSTEGAWTHAAARRQRHQLRRHHSEL